MQLFSPLDGVTRSSWPSNRRAAAYLLDGAFRRTISTAPANAGRTIPVNRPQFDFMNACTICLSFLSFC